MQPVVSICMPNYNGEKYIKEAIDSVLAQTYENFELIIVDDASTDSSVEIIKSYKDSRIKLFQNEKNLHTSGTVNRAISLSVGEIISILHSDDKFELNFLEEIISSIKKYPKNKVFVTGVYFYRSTIGSIKPWDPYDTEGVINRVELLVKLSLGNNIGNGINLVMYRECFNETGLFSEKYKYLADYDYWLRLAEKYDFVYIPKKLAYYRIHESNTTHSIIKDITFQTEGLAVCRKNINNTKVINKNSLKSLSRLGRKQMIRKAFDYGFRYKSGNVMRKVLRNTSNDSPLTLLEPDFYFIYAISFLVFDKAPLFLQNIVNVLGRIALYPNKVIVNYISRKLIKENAGELLTLCLVYLLL